MDGGPGTYPCYECGSMDCTRADGPPCPGKARCDDCKCRLFTSDIFCDQCRPNHLNVPIVLAEGAKTPTYAKPGDAAADLYSLTDVTLNPHDTTLVPTGVKMAIPRGYYGRIAPRSGLALRSHIMVNGGVIDSGYRDNIGIILHNLGDHAVTLDAGTRVAQIIFEKIGQATFRVVSELNETERKGGFGSTGK